MLELVDKDFKIAVILKDLHEMKEEFSEHVRDFWASVKITFKNSTGYPRTEHYHF